MEATAQLFFNMMDSAQKPLHDRTKVYQLDAIGLFMTKKSAKQMTWHKKGKQYNAEKMVYLSDGEAQTRFDEKHPEKADEARNVCVALATDGFNPYRMIATSYTCWPMFVIPLSLPPVSPFNDNTYSCR
jgi:hypothetical protein